MPADSLQLVLKHIPGTRAPLGGQSRLARAGRADRRRLADEAPDALLARLLAPLIDSGLVEDAVIAASEAQAEAFWRIRDSISEAERADGPTRRTTSACRWPTCPRFMVEAAGEVEARLSRHAGQRLRSSWRRQRPFPRPRRRARPRRTGTSEQAPAITRLVHDLVTAAGGSISAEHGIGQMKRDELARLAPERVARAEGDQARARPQGHHEPGQAGLN